MKHKNEQTTKVEEEADEADDITKIGLIAPTTQETGMSMSPAGGGPP